MDGILNLNKPVGITSAKALYRVRKILGQRKSGHAGTLDPAADGVLLLGLGKGTKLTESLMDLPKVYRTTARLDVTSASFDADETVVPVAVTQRPNMNDVRGALARFEGTIQQAPPALSAIKIGGQPAYRLARKGRPPQLEPRPVTVYWIHLQRYAWPELEFAVACGRGTYIRALIRDLGAALGAGGCLTTLRRTAIGPFDLASSADFDQLERDQTAGFVPLETARSRLAEQGAHVPPRPPD